MEPTTEMLTTEQLTELVTSDLDWMTTFMTLPPLNLTRILSTLKTTKGNNSSDSFIPFVIYIIL